MEKHMIYYYSKSGNNKYLAQRLAKELKCNYEPIKPLPNAFLFLVFSTLIGLGCNIMTLKTNPSDYQKVILCGPIWMGNLVAPLRKFIKKYGPKTKEIILINFCGSNDEDNKTGFGFEKVHNIAKEISKGKIIQTYALSLKDIRKNNKPLTDDEIMKIKMNDEFLSGKILEQFNKLVEDLN